MKLRNKKTGEIKDWSFAMLQNIGQTTEWKHYASLSELNKDWEDYEEPSEQIENIWTGNRRDKTIHIKCNSEEYAKKVLLKFKAWKRLKDKGFKFIGKTYETDKRFGSIFYEVDKDTYSEDIIHELELLFGGEDA